MRTTIVIPTYNERENLRPLVERIARLRISDLDVLIVDDDSPDGTGAVAEELVAEYAQHPTPSRSPLRAGASLRAGPSLRGGYPSGAEPGLEAEPEASRREGEKWFNIHVLHRKRKEGLGAALTAGFQVALNPKNNATYFGTGRCENMSRPEMPQMMDEAPDVIIQMDADGSHDPEVIPLMIEYLYSQASFRGHAEESHMHVRASHDVRSLPPEADERSARDEEKTIDVVIGSRRVSGGRIVGWGLHRRAMSTSAQWLARRVLGFRTRDVTSGFRAWRADALARVLGTAPVYGS